MSFFDRFRRRRSREEVPESSDIGDSDVEAVEGERGVSAVQRPPSLQSRLSNLLAMGLMGTLGVGLLGWYYVHILDTRAHTRQAAQTSAQEKAKGDVNLRPLGRVDPPVPATPPQNSALQSILGAPPAPPPTTPAWPSSAGAPPPAATPAQGYAAKTPRDLQIERELGGPAFAGNSPRSAGAAGASEEAAAHPGAERPADEMDKLLRPSVTQAVNAEVLPTQRLLLPKGAFLDCTLETAIDSTLPGMTTCVLATDTFSADGSVVLLERGTKLVGETRGQVQQGSNRVFVLWSEARTPRGIIVPLASPGTDELGRSGLPGAVNRHFLERFGAAILISVIDGTVQAAASRETNTVIVNPSSSGEVVTEVLKSTVNIPPTVVKPQGDRIQVFVARDLDFRSVYELRPTAGH